MMYHFTVECFYFVNTITKVDNTVLSTVCKQSEFFYLQKSPSEHVVVIL